MPVRVLFVCYANICRSPMAQAVFAAKVADAGLSGEILSDSAGVSYQTFGSDIHPSVHEILAGKGIDYAHTPRRITKTDLDTYDHVLAADLSVLKSVWGMGKGKAKVEALLKYAPLAGASEVPDPLKTGNFSLVYDLVDTAAAGLLAKLKSAHQL